ncbi:MAG: hypothetical protein EOR02_34025 [Mesorhizobium sp.]|nr:MAG: hypothetical protein EOR02_34025 [Mesorhizobium sp.]
MIAVRIHPANKALYEGADGPHHGKPYSHHSEYPQLSRNDDEEGDERQLSPMQHPKPDRQLSAPRWQQEIIFQSQLVRQTPTAESGWIAAMPLFICQGPVSVDFVEKVRKLYLSTRTPE